MRTGAIFARGSCRALKWMALVGMAFALGGGEALAQVTGAGVIEAQAHGYSKKIVVVDLDTNVWGTNVPASAFAISGNIGDTVTGISAGSPGDDKFTITFVSDVAVGASVTYTPPGDAGRELKMADGADAGTDPDQVVGFSFTVTEEDNAPVLPAIPAITVNQATTYTAASPAGKLPAVTGGSGTGTIAYTVAPTSPFGLTVDTAPTSADFGKITGGPPDSIGTLQVTWTATDGDSPTESVRRMFQLIVQAIPATPDKPTVESAASGSLTVSWSAPMDNGSAITHYKVRYKGKGASNYLETATLAASAGTMTTLTGLTNGTEYSVGVQALNGIGWSGWSADGKGTPAMPAVTAPGMPSVTATAGDGAVTLAWAAVTGATKYQYAYARTGSTMGAWMPEAGQSTMTATVGGLTNGMGYTFHVRAGNAVGYGEAGMATATPMAPGVMPKSPADIMAAVKAAQMAADSDGDGMWTPQDGPATVALTAVFNNLPETFNAEAMSSHPSVVQASVLSSSALMRASNPAVLLTPVSVGSASVTVTAAGSQAMLTVPVKSPMVTGVPSARRLSSVSRFTVREGGQAQVTISLNAAVEPRRTFKAKLRLVGQTQTREDGRVAVLASPPANRVVEGVSVPLTGELGADNYDANVIGELTIQPGYSSGTVTITTGTDDDAEHERLELQVIKDGQTFSPHLR